MIADRQQVRDAYERVLRKIALALEIDPAPLDPEIQVMADEMANTQMAAMEE